MSSRILAVLSLLILCCRVSSAQQTIFNVPSQDVLEYGKVYTEFDAVARFSTPSFNALTPRIVVGLGDGVEIGLNVPGYTNFDQKNWTAIATFKSGEYLGVTETWTFTYGAHAYFPLTKSRIFGLFGYITGGYDFNKSFRISAGMYGATSAVSGQDNIQLGALGGLELTVLDWLTFAADAYSGDNALSYITPGIILEPFPNLGIYTGYQFSSLSSDLNSYLLELGWTF